MRSQRKKELWRYASKNCGAGNMASSSSYGYGCVNNSDDMVGEDEYLQTKRGRSRSPTTHQPQQQQQQQQPTIETNSVLTFANSASNLIRKYCCGVSIFNSSSSSNNNSNNNNSEKLNDIANNSQSQQVVQLSSNSSSNNMPSTLEPLNSQQSPKILKHQPPPTTPPTQTPPPPPAAATAPLPPATILRLAPAASLSPPPKTIQRQCFDALIKHMKRQQVNALCLAVKSRVEDCAAAIQSPECQQQIGDCILIPNTPILGEEPHVIAYRLFLDSQINSYQLKRLPHCLSEHNPLSVCCNILHWGRILETDIAPPPYRRAGYENKDISSGESFQDEENSITRSIENSTLSSQGMLPNLRVRIPESLTTDGEGRRSDSTSWCKVAYWELKNRVGDIHLAKKPSVNICLNSAYCNKEVSEEVSLHSLASTKGTPSPCKVENTRQKIGLGIVLSDEPDGVWLYNRSMEPIFVHSPTLCESWFQVCKVLRGECLLAFDYQRARELQDLSRLPGAQAGPVDKYSMRISFVKGYGQQYKRQDLTQCPCWLEVHFTNVGR